MKNFCCNFARIFLLCLTILAQTVVAGENHVSDTIGSIDGAKIVHVWNGKAMREARSGDPVAPGETVVTDENTTATVHCSDGTVLVIARKSKLTIEGNTDSPRSAQVDNGTIRAIVSHGANGKFKFIIRSPSATMGVRGTDFVVHADESASFMELHTLSGVVTVAKDVKTLLSEGGTDCIGGQELKATPDHIEKPHVFDVRLFAEEMSHTGLSLPKSLPPATRGNSGTSASPSPSARPAWTKRSNYIKGDRVYFVGASSDAVTVEEGRKQAKESVEQELRSYVKAEDVQSIPLTMNMTYEEKVGDHYKVFRVDSAPLKTIEKFKAEHAQGH